MKPTLRAISSCLLFGGQSVLLLLLAATWQLPMIMYDHLDLIPVLEQFEAGNLSMEKMLAWYGGHIHVAAYLVLLLTTQISNGWLMADILASWIFLLAYSGVMCMCIHHIQMGPGIAQREWPEVAPDVLASLYPTDPAVAVRGLQYLHDHQYPPFRDERTSRGQ